jgi:Ran GTPase-activating protein (RanGAP) involved in mRNA processing and transport
LNSFDFFCKFSFFLFRFWSRPTQSKKVSISQKSYISNGIYRNISLEQLIVESGRGWTVDLDEQNLTDRDMKTVVKHAMIKNHCKRIRLRDNNITSQGALILADGLNNNMTLESLDLRNNSISDLGVQYLSLSIIHSNLKTLNLESNGITAEGAQYLAQMLKNNRTLTELYLSKNHLGDRGIELLANALNDEKKNYQDQENRGVSGS